MEARVWRAAALAVLLFVSMGAQHRSANFVVEAPTPQLAQQIAAASEKYRHDLAVEWLGAPMPNWSAPCMMTVRLGPNLGAGGATEFIFNQGEVYGWRMNIQGSVERVFDSVLPHEITHMILASHFRQPLPRWADEGAATSVEHSAERMKHRKMLVEFLQTGRGISFNRMFAMRDYPPDYMPLYAQGYSVADYLIQIGGRRKYVEFLGDGLKSNDWPGAVRRHYGIDDLGKLQGTWLAWVRQGSPNLKRQPAGAPEVLLASNNSSGSPNPSHPTSPTRSIYDVAQARWATGNAATGTSAGARGASPRSPATETVASTPPPQPAVVLPSSGWRAAGTGPAEATALVAVGPPSSVRASGAAEAPLPGGATVAPGWPGDSTSRSTQVTRPQPAQQPRQRIIEWSRP